MKKLLVLTLSICWTITTVHAQSSEDKKERKKEIAEREYQKSKDLIQSGEFTFVALQAQPMGGERFFMNTIPNYIHIDKEEADIYMPYFGVVHMSNGYSKEAGIKYKGKLDNYKVSYNDKKQSIDLKFEVSTDKELIEFNFDIYKAGATTLVLASTRRKAISYFGQFRALEKPLTN